MGNEAYKKKDFATAHQHYAKAIELDPTNITFYSNNAGKLLMLLLIYMLIFSTSRRASTMSASRNARRESRRVVNIVPISHSLPSKIFLFVR